MNIEKTEKIFSLMKQYRVSHFKSQKLEVEMDIPSSALLDLDESIGAIAEIPKGPEAQSAPPVEMSIPHHENEVANLLKLSDEDLVDKLFPDYSNLPKEAGE